jgi:hypothetical protein
MDQKHSLLRIERSLRGLRRLVRSAVALRGGALFLAILAALILCSWGIDRSFRLSSIGRSISLSLLGGFAAWALFRVFVRPIFARFSDRALADVLEKRFHELEDTVRSAVDFQRQPGIFLLTRPEVLGEDARLSILMKRRVLDDAASRLDAAPRRELVAWKRIWRALAIGVVVCGGTAVWATLRAESFGIWFRRNVLFENADWPYATRLIVEGFVDGRRGVPHGDALEIRVRAEGEDPVLVTMRMRYATEESRVTMVREEAVREEAVREEAVATSSSVFVHTHGSVTEPFRLTFQGGDFRSEEYEVVPLVRPRVDLAKVTLAPPSYTSVPDIVAEGVLGELSAPEGSELRIEGRANKPLRRAWLETENRTIELQVADATFRGSYVPAVAASVTMQLEDVENVPPNENLQFSVHLVPDRAPKVGVRIEGLGSMITSFARMPIAIDAQDDYLVERLSLEWSLDPDPEAGPEAGSRGEVALEAPETKEAHVITKRTWEVESLGLRPDRRLNVRLGATDNDGLHGAKTGYSNMVSFLIVTPERLGEEFIRREEEQRRLLERVLEEERELRDVTFRLVGTVWGKEEAIPGPAIKDMLALARLVRQHGRQCDGIADAVRQIVAEMENNGIGEADDLERLAQLIVTPLRSLAEDSMPSAAREVGAIRELTTAAERLEKGIALSQRFEAQIDTIEQVIARMKRLEGFTAIVQHLRGIIKTHDESLKAAEQELDSAVDELFEPDSGNDPKDGASGGATEGGDR